MKTAFEMATEQAEFLKKLSYKMADAALEFEDGSQMAMYNKGRSDAFMVAYQFMHNSFFPIILKAKEESHETTTAFTTN